MFTVEHYNYNNLKTGPIVCYIYKDQVRKILAKFLVPSSYSGNEANSDEDVFAWMATGAALGKAEKCLCVSALARSVWLFSFYNSISRRISLPSGSLYCTTT